MRNQTIKKDPNNRGLSELFKLVRSTWLGMRDLLMIKYFSLGWG